MRIFITSLFLLCALACGQPATQLQEDKASLQPDTICNDTIMHLSQASEVMATIPKYLRPVTGYRFIVDGDFNGDGRRERLVERFISRHTGGETNKLYDQLENFLQLVVITAQKEPVSFVQSLDGATDTLLINSGGQMLGLSLLRNEGDLNQDGRDELGYVVNWADWSSINTYHIVTYKNNQWEPLYEFEIRDWQLPALPERQSRVNYFIKGTGDAKIVGDSLNAALEKKLQSFKGCVTPLGKGKIRVRYMDDWANELQRVVDLHHPGRNP